MYFSHDRALRKTLVKKGDLIWKEIINSISYKVCKGGAKGDYILWSFTKFSSFSLPRVQMSGTTGLEVPLG